jgi:hypothetical protein
MSSLDHGKIGPNWPKDIFVGQNNGTNNGKPTIAANILNFKKFSAYPILVSNPRNMIRSCPNLPAIKRSSNKK